MMRLKLNEQNKSIFLVSFAVIIVLLNCLCYSLPVVAASSSSSVTTELPLPYGTDTGYGYSVSDSEIANYVSLIVQNYQRIVGGGGEPVQVVYMVEEGNGYLILGATRGGFTFSSDTHPNYPAFSDLTYLSYYNLNTTGTGYRFRCENGSVSLVWDSFNNVNPYYSWSQVMPTGSNGIAPGVALYGYPLWTYSDSDVDDGNGHIIFTRSLPNVSGNGSVEGTGTYTPDDTTQSGGSYQFSFDFSAILDKLDSLFDGFSDLFDDLKNTLGNLLDTIKDDIADIKDIVFGIENPAKNVTGTWIMNEFNSNSVFGGIIQLTSAFSANIGLLFSDLGNVTFTDGFPVVVYDWDWVLPFLDSPYFDDVILGGTIRVNFRWWEDVGPILLPIIFTFIYLGWFLYIFRQIPNFINGVSGGVSGVIGGISHLSASDKSEKGGSK